MYKHETDKGWLLKVTALLFTMALNCKKITPHSLLDKHSCFISFTIHEAWCLIHELIKFYILNPGLS